LIGGKEKKRKRRPSRYNVLKNRSVGWATVAGGGRKKGGQTEEEWGALSVLATAGVLEEGKRKGGGKTTARY